MLAQSKRSDKRDVYKHCMDNVIRTESEMFCQRFAFIFINDFNQAFTPVAEFEITYLDVKQEVVQEDDSSRQNIELQKMVANYFNLELGEWEPLIENLALNADVNQTLTTKIVTVNFVDSVVLNVTQACLRNFAYTYEAWNAMPEFSKPRKKAPEIEQAAPDVKENHQKSLQGTIAMQMQSHDSGSSYSINSEEESKQSVGQMKLILTTDQAKQHKASDRVLT